MKSTRYEYMKKTDSWLKSNSYPNNDYLEISGNTKEWHKYFKNITCVQYPEVDAHNLPFEDESYDCVALNQVLEHVKKPWVCVQEAHRVLRKGGIALICSPFFYQVHDYPADYWRFTVDGLEALCDDFSEVLMKEKSGNAKMIKHMVDNPKDRGSPAFKAIEYLPFEPQNLYYVKSMIIVRK
jgi:ubiquinone/menaquinone biosynthesis C-methylase UbiE